MNFEQTYRSMNERIAPDSALVADTLARMERGEKPRHRPRRLRRMIAAAAAAAVAVGCMTPALAASVPAVYQALYDISPSIAQALMPVNVSCESNGVTMEVVSAAINGDTAGVYLTLTDASGDLFGELAPAFSEGWALNSPSSDLGYMHTLLSYDAATRTATFYLELTNLDGQSFSDGKYTLTLPSLLIGRDSQSDVSIPVGLSTVPLDPPTEQQVCYSIAASGDGTPEAQQAIWDNAYDFLLPQDTLWQSEDGVFALAAAGYRDGRLHLLFSSLDRKRCENQASLFLSDAHGAPVEPDFVATYFNPDGADCAFEEWVFPIAYDQLSQSTLTGWLRTAGGQINGSWQVTFRLESK